MKIIKKIKEIGLALYEPDYPINQHFAFVLYKGRILVTGRSKPKTHPINRRNPTVDNGGNWLSDKYICAEWDATRKLIKTTEISFNRLKLFVLRVDNNRRIAYSKPCRSCINLLDKFCDYKQVFFTNREGDFIEL